MIPQRAAWWVLAAALTVTGCVRPAQPLRDPPKFGRAAVASVPPAPTPAPAPRSPADTSFVDYVGSDTVYFARDRADLTDEARKVLDRQAEWLVAHPTQRALLEGHADELGTREIRFALAAGRAAAMRFHLVARGVAADRLGVVSYGKELPVVTGWSEREQQPNRRGRTTLVGPGAGPTAR